MKKSKFTEEQILAILKEQENGLKSGWNLPKTRRNGSNILQPEEEIGWSFIWRTAQTKRVRAREQPIKTDHSWSGFGYSDIKGCQFKKVVTSGQKEQYLQLPDAMLSVNHYRHHQHQQVFAFINHSGQQYTCPRWCREFYFHFFIVHGIQHFE